MANDAPAAWLTRRVALALVGPLRPPSGGAANRTSRLRGPCVKAMRGGRAGHGSSRS